MIENESSFYNPKKRITEQRQIIELRKLVKKKLAEEKISNLISIING